jgi:hypothetical protein
LQPGSNHIGAHIHDEPDIISYIQPVIYALALACKARIFTANPTMDGIHPLEKVGKKQPYAVWRLKWQNLAIIHYG